MNLLAGFLSAQATGFAAVDPPQISPLSGRSPVTFQVTVNCPTPAAEIHYTTDGTEPTLASPTILTGGTLWVAKSTQLKAKAWLGTEASTTTTITYDVTGAVAAGWNHSLAVRTSSSGYGWGLRTDGRLANGLTTAANVSTPGPLLKSAGVSVTDAYTVAAGATHSLMLDTSGKVWSFGANNVGQLGNNTTVTAAYPVQVLKSTTPGDFLTACTGIAAGDEFSLAVSQAGQVYSWGSRANGRLGDGSTSGSVNYATLVEKNATGDPALTGIVEVATSAGHVLAREKHAYEQPGATGKVWCWGLNTNQQLGIVPTTNQNQARPMMRNGGAEITDVTAIAAGGKHSVLVRWLDGNADLQGSVWCCGYEGHGALGNGLSGLANVQFPTRVLKVGGGYLDHIVEVAAGPRHTLALDDQGFVWCWGSNARGELGIGTTAMSNRATRVKDYNGTGFLSNIVSIAAGGTGDDGFSIAIAADGVVHAWGANTNGQLGNYTTNTGATNLPVVAGAVLGNITPAITVSGTLVDNIEQGEISVTATPTDQDGAADIVKVEFFSGQTLVGSLNSAPWTFVWDTVPAGYHPIVAVVTDRAGNTAQAITSAFRVYAADDDEDGDGLTNGNEKSLGLDPFDADTDDDGMEDGFEVYYAFPADSGANQGGAGTGPDDDFDGDLTPNRIEARDGRLPKSSAERPEVTVADPKTIQWFGVKDVHYRLQWSTNLVTWNFHGGTHVGQNKGFEFLVSDVVGGPPPGLFFIRLFIFTDPELDTDGDGLTDLEETYSGSDPEVDDTDGDGMPDAWEVQYGLKPTSTAGVDGATGDFDGDGLNNLAEYNAGSTPNHWDSDHDGVSDGTDPTLLANDALADRDGANLPTAVTTGILGRWDFETFDLNGLLSTPATGLQAGGTMEIANRGAGWEGDDAWPMATSGIPWNCLHLTTLGSHAKVPTTRLNTGVQTWAMWIKFSSGALDASLAKRTLFSIGADENGAAATGYPQIQCYLDGKLAGASDNKLVLSTYLSGVETQLASFNTPAALDDGKWHHIAVYFNHNNGGHGNYQFWFDGANAGATAQGNVFTLNLTNATAPWCYLGRFKKSYVPTGHEPLGAQIDRLRVFGKVLQNADAAALYNQDIDRDGLFDRTEIVDRFWRDHNDNGINEQSETTFPVDPFSYDPVGSDHDRDGLSSHDEQTIGTKLWRADTDGDLLPDGWEVEHGLNPLVHNGGGSTDSDGDGLPDSQEYIWGTDPNDPDSDDDGKPDGQEVTGGSHPGDNTDGGQPTPADEVLTIKIGVGDQSGSHSEDYVVECYRIDPSTGEEKKHYTVRSGGHGQYIEQNFNMFRKGVTYTFQLKWQSTNNQSGGGDGPDYDYTFKIEPQETHGGILIDSWDKATNTADASKKLLAVNANDVATDESDFQTKIEDRRVVLASLGLVKPKAGSSSDFEVLSKPKVAKWEDAFTDYQYTGNYATLDPDFIEKDRDRFYVQFLNIANIDVQFGTRYGLQGLDVTVDPLNQIAVTAGPSTGLLARSKSMILAANELDDTLAIKGAGKDESQNDRSHRVRESGRIRMKVTVPGFGSAERDIERSERWGASVQDCVIIPDSNGAKGMAASEFRNHLHTYVRPRYLQCDIYFYASDAAAREVARPAGMTTTSGILIGFPNVNESWGQKFQEAIDPVLNAYGTEAQDGIQVFLFTSVKKMEFKAVQGQFMLVPEPFAFAIPGAALADYGMSGNNKAAWTIFYAPGNVHGSTGGSEEDIVLAHELGHILTNEGHYAGPKQWVNIMMQSASVSIPQNAQAAGNWRWFEAQDAKLKQSSFVHDTE